MAFRCLSLRTYSVVLRLIVAKRYPAFCFFFDFALFLFLCQGFPLQHHTTNKIFFFFFSHSSFPNSLGGTFLADYKYRTLLGLRSRPLSFYLSSAANFFIPVSAVIAIRNSSFIVQVFETT